jgi:transketolase
MRAAFVETLTALAERDPRVVLMTGDLGFNMLEPFAERFPDRFFNVGVAEQNMVGVATGLAESGLIPYVYSIATFATARSCTSCRCGSSAWAAGSSTATTARATTASRMSESSACNEG